MTKVLLLLLLCGCGFNSPQYKIGDCLSFDLSNPFKTDFMYYRVKDIKDDHYLLEGGGGWERVRNKISVDGEDYIEKTDISKCWKEGDEW